MSETKDSVKIRHLMEQAERLPKHDSIVVLKTLLATVAEEDGDWTQTLRMAIEEVEEREEAAELHSRYRISKQKTTAFVKLFRIIYDLHIFETTTPGAMPLKTQEGSEASKDGRISRNDMAL